MAMDSARKRIPAVSCVRWPCDANLCQKLRQIAVIEAILQKGVDHSEMSVYDVLEVTWTSNGRQPIICKALQIQPIVLRQFAE
jgi:hypothetical protein